MAKAEIIQPKRNFKGFEIDFYKDPFDSFYTLIFRREEDHLDDTTVYLSPADLDDLLTLLKKEKANGAIHS